MTDQQPPPRDYPQPYKVRRAVAWAWSRFRMNAAAVIVPTLVYVSVVIGLSLILRDLAARVAPYSVYTFSSDIHDAAYSFISYFGSASHIVMIIGAIVMIVVVGVMQSAYFGGMLDIAAGRQVTIGSFFKPRNVGRVIIASLIVAVLMGIGAAACIGIGGLIVGLFSMFTIIALLDRNLLPMDAVIASYRITKANFGKLLLAALVVMYAIFLFGVLAYRNPISVLGALAFVVGVFAVIPVAALFLVYTYRHLSDGQVEPLLPEP